MKNCQSLSEKTAMNTDILFNKEKRIKIKYHRHGMEYSDV